MINIVDQIKKTMKHQIYAEENINKCARNVLAQFKTKLFDITAEITNEIQYKALKKMKSQREQAMSIYANRSLQLYSKQKNEYEIIDNYMKKLQKQMPKQMTQEQIRNIIKELKEKNSNINIGMIMKQFKDKNCDKGLVAKIAKE